MIIKPKYVYIAGPYSKGYVVTNVQNAVKAADILVVFGHIPYIPHLTMVWDMISLHPYDFWVEQDNKWLLKCDCVLRLEGESEGADREVELAKANDIPVFYSIDELLYTDR